MGKIIPPQKPGPANWNGLTLFLLSIAAAVLCAMLVWPFLPALTGAVVLAVVTRRPYRWLAARLRNRTLAAALALVLAVVSVVTPVMLVAYGVGQHVLEAVRTLQGSSAEQEFRHFIDQHQRIGAFFRSIAVFVDPGQALQRSAGAAAGKVGTFLGHSIVAILQIVVMLFVLFFLYRDEREALRLAHTLLPLENAETDYLLGRAQPAIEALVLGRFTVAGIQGLVAGFTMAMLGVDSAVLLGLATVLFSVVPAVGAYVVWLPVVIYLALAHQWVQAIILLAVGSLVISTLDNFLYPILVGPGLRMHFVPILLSMAGGVLLLGVAGVILGPLAFNVTSSLLSIWRSRRYGEPLSADLPVL
ncbi:MAG: AI-2E family transporter [Acidobacteriota bacterium]